MGCYFYLAFSQSPILQYLNSAIFRIYSLRHLSVIFLKDAMKSVIIRLNNLKANYEVSMSNRKKQINQTHINKRRNRAT
jgi:hypothetical protein